MTTRYAQHVSKRTTPQNEPIPGSAQVENSAGGYVYDVDKWQRLTRFLILGSDGGTYYVKERKLTRDNAACIEACCAEDAERTVREIVSVSDGGRAPKNDQAELALAIVAASCKWTDRKLAYDALPKVCRIPTHLFHFLAFCKELRGWSGGLRRAVARWYGRWTPDQLAFELAKYQSRDGWANKDAFRLAHGTYGPAYEPVLRWAHGLPIDAARDVKRKHADRVDHYTASVLPLPAILAAFEEAKTADMARVVHLIRDHGLTREMVPTSHLNEPKIWDVLLEKMPPQAMVRNLAKMTAVGLLKPLSAAATTVVGRLTDETALRKSRLHPMAILNALRVYQSGHGEKGSLTWTPVQDVCDALDAAFYLAFGNVEPTGKRHLLALDVSGSMGAMIGGTSLSCREAAAAMALVTLHVEPSCLVVGFTALAGGGYSGRAAISPLRIARRQRLDDVVEYTNGLEFGATDCALPMLYALHEKLDVDAFCLYTDSETWAGSVHPSQALKEYRRQRIAAAKQVVVGMTSTGFTIADPEDLGSLDVVGFDLATPQAIRAFVA